jgi:hypothetical protein
MRPELLDQVWNRLVFLHGSGRPPGDDPHEVRGLQAYRYLAELGRTDKQLGATRQRALAAPLSPMKPEFPNSSLLRWKHGAIEQFGERDRPDPRDLSLRLCSSASSRTMPRISSITGVWRRIGGSVTFDMRSEDPTDSERRHQSGG